LRGAYGRREPPFVFAIIAIHLPFGTSDGSIRLHDESRGQDRSAQARHPQGHFAVVLPGAKIGVLGLNGSGKSSLLRIMAGEDKEFDGEAVPMPECASASCRRSRSSTAQDVRETSRRSGESSRRETELDESTPPMRNRRRLRQARRRAGEVRSDHRTRRRDTDVQMEIAADALAAAAVGCEDRNLSGGEKRRVALVPLAAVEARHAAARRADQPSRRRSVEWLEQFLQRFPAR
jgi:sulfate-transporting ATPase